ncbi:MAG: LytTR family transcriptional regulator DNA-binding domain-containing protein [Saprospiraceae bacterium]|nr:LytTR family transcriptional regulator DNA-binding domain-containing protein [Saprospiraceae bacterium]
MVIANEFQEAGYLLSINTFDVIFLNISLINKNKYEVIDELINKNKLVCYSTNPSDANIAFDICAKDFFILPINIDRIQKSIFRVISNYNFENIKNQKILFKTGKNSLYINENELQYIEAYGNYIKIYSNENINIILEKISTIENRLSKNLFLRVHRSYIINKNFISFKRMII